MWMKKVSKIILLSVTLAGALVPGVAAQSPYEVHEVPLRAEGGWLVVPVVTPTGDTLSFIVDTAAGVTVLGASGAEAMAAEPSGKATVTGASGPMEVKIVRAPELAVGDLSIRATERVVIDDDAITSDDRIVFHGILGIDFLRSFDVLIDAPGGRMLLRQPGGEGSDWPGLALDEPVKISFVMGSFIRIDVEVNGLPVRSILDTGARDIVLNRAAANAVSVRRTSEPAPIPHRGIGAEEVIGYNALVKTLTFGQVLRPDVEVTVADLPVFGLFGAEQVVLLGSPLFRECALAISYRQAEHRTCLRP
jgi:predicted aspartyl protease